MRWMPRRRLIKVVRLWQRAIHALFSLKRNTTLLIAGVLFAAIAAVDYATPPQLNLTFLYVFVILLVCWNVGATAGLVFAALASVMQFIVFPESRGLALQPFYRYVILGNRIFTFLLVVGLTIPLRQLYALAQRTSRIDFLTKLPNRMALYELIAAESARNQRTGNPFSVAYLDCDNFKDINDRLGHEEGDALLRSCANTFRRMLRATDAVARLGGDEFVVLLPDTGKDTALQIMDRIRDELDRRMLENSWSVTFSVGLGVFNRPGLSPEEIINSCDTLMYKVKDHRKNCLAWNLIGSRDAAHGPESNRRPKGS